MVVITVQKSFGSLQPIMDIKARRAQVKNPSGIDGFRMFKGPKIKNYFSITVIMSVGLLTVQYVLAHFMPLISFDTP